MLEAIVTKTVVLAVVGAIGVEYGRRHPETPWGDMIDEVRYRVDKAKRKSDPTPVEEPDEKIT